MHQCSIQGRDSCAICVFCHFVIYSSKLEEGKKKTTQNHEMAYSCKKVTMLKLKELTLMTDTYLQKHLSIAHTSTS